MSGIAKFGFLDEIFKGPDVDGIHRAVAGDQLVTGRSDPHFFSIGNRVFPGCNHVLA